MQNLFNSYSLLIFYNLEYIINRERKINKEMISMPNYEIISWDETTDISDHYSHDYLHLHQAYEILMLLSGEIDVLYYNQNQEITHQYHGVPGDLFFFASLEIHQIKITAFPYRRVGVRFSLHVFQNLFHNLALSTIYNYHGKQFCHQIRTSTSSELESSKNFLLSIHNEYLHQRPFYHDNMEYLIGQFTIALYRLKPEAFPVIEKEQLHILEEIKQYLQQNFTQSIQINVLARRFYLSHSYLCRAFKDYTGMTPKQYLCLCRLTYVRELLITTSLPLEAIAESAGINDANSLIRLFRKMTGVTPGTYRSAMQQEHSFSHGASLPSNSAAELAIGTQLLNSF